MRLRFIIRLLPSFDLRIRLSAGYACSLVRWLLFISVRSWRRAEAFSFAPLRRTIPRPITICKAAVLPMTARGRVRAASRCDLPIVPAALGVDTGFVGAALAARD